MRCSLPYLKAFREQKARLLAGQIMDGPRQRNRVNYTCSGGGEDSRGGSSLGMGGRRQKKKAAATKAAAANSDDSSSGGDDSSSDDDEVEIVANKNKQPKKDKVRLNASP